jgi:hypothetical protein
MEPFTWKEKHKLIGGSHRGQGRRDESERDTFTLDDFRVLLRGGDFFDDGLYGRSRIAGRKDGPAHDDEICAGTDRFRRRRGSGLIISLR